MWGLMLAGLLSMQVAKSQPVETAPLVSVTPSERVLAIPEGLREEFAAKVLHTNSQEQRLYKLVDFMLKPDGLGLSYQPDANNTVEETYRTRQVNCMAFTMMAVALAREAGLTAYAQQLDKVMAWDMTGDVVTQSLHANAVVIVGARKYMLDIAGSTFAQPVVDYPIEDEHLLALFYGNRAMQYMIEGRLQEADAWQREAMRHGVQDAGLLNNTGVLRQRLQDTVAAEHFYRKALEVNPVLSSAVANLIALYEQRGDIRQANIWRQYSSRLLRKDPYYQFAQGRRDEAAGDYRQALDHYLRAISLHGDEHQFHFAIARIYFNIGELDKAAQELSIASELSRNGEHQRYQDKLAALRRMQH